MHCGVPFLCNLWVFKESLQRKEGKKINHSWPLQYFYHCLPEEEVMVVWCTRCTGPSSTAGTASDAHNSRQACQGKLWHGRSRAIIGKKPWVRNTTTSTFSRQSFSCFPWAETSDLGEIKKLPATHPSVRKKDDFFFLNTKKLGFGLNVNFRITVKPHAPGTIEQTASDTPVCSCHMPSALADAGTPHNKQGQRAGRGFPCAIRLGGQ